MIAGPRRVRTWLRSRTITIVFGTVLLMTISILRPAIGLGQDITIGAVEEITILPWNITLPARIDTGARRTSLDARDLKIVGKTVNFRLVNPNGKDQIIRLPLKGMQRVHSASGNPKRPVVEMTICIGQKKMTIDVNLANRSRMTYPLLVGRNVIKQGFLVDVRQSKILPPACVDKIEP